MSISSRGSILPVLRDRLAHAHTHAQCFVEAAEAGVYFHRAVNFLAEVEQYRGRVAVGVTEKRVVARVVDAHLTGEAVEQVLRVYDILPCGVGAPYYSLGLYNRLYDSGFEGMKTVAERTAAQH